MDTAPFLADLRAQRERIDQAIAALEALTGKTDTPAKTAAPHRLPPRSQHQPLHLLPRSAR